MFTWFKTYTAKKSYKQLAEELIEAKALLNAAKSKRRVIYVNSNGILELAPELIAFYDRYEQCKALVDRAYAQLA